MKFLVITIAIILPLIFINPKKLMLFSILPWWALRREDREDIFDGSLFSFCLTLSKRISSRKRALKAAKPFLKKYKKIFGDQTLSNKTCQISILKTKDKTLQILCISKVATEDTNQKPMLTAEHPEGDRQEMELFWNDTCTSFSSATSYQSLLDDCSRRALKIEEHQISSATNKSKVEYKQKAPETSAKVEPIANDKNENVHPQKLADQKRILDL